MLSRAFVVSLTGVVANLLFGKNNVQVRTSRSTRRVGPDANTPERPNTHKPIKDDDVIDI